MGAETSRHRSPADPVFAVLKVIDPNSEGSEGSEGTEGTEGPERGTCNSTEYVRVYLMVGHVGAYAKCRELERSEDDAEFFKERDEQCHRILPPPIETRLSNDVFMDLRCADGKSLYEGSIPSQSFQDLKVNIVSSKTLDELLAERASLRG